VSPIVECRGAVIDRSLGEVCGKRQIEMKDIKPECCHPGSNLP
jgi:hypothetical protein